VKTIFLVLANLFLFSTVVLYFWNVAVAGVTPNPTTFLIRAIVATMNCFSYFTVVNKDYLLLSVALVSTFSLTVMFLYALVRGRLTKLRTVDVVCAIAALIIGVIWKSTGNAVLANLLLQAIMLLAFYPAISGVLAGIAKEKTLPWVLATLCYVCMILAIITDWHAGAWYSLVHPVVSGICGNGGLAFAIWWKNTNK